MREADKNTPEEYLTIEEMSGSNAKTLDESF